MSDDQDLIPDRPVHELSDREILVLMCERQTVSNRRLDGLYARVVAQDTRIGSLETWRTFLAGSWATITLVGAVAGKWIWTQLTTKHP